MKTVFNLISLCALQVGVAQAAPAQAVGLHAGVAPASVPQAGAPQPIVARASVPRLCHPVRVEREAYLMGTILRAEVSAASREAGVAAIEAVFEEVRRLEEVLSSWTGDSEIGRLNAAPVGERVAVSRELWDLLREAEAWARRTDGAFDPAVGALVDAWDLRGIGRRPAEAVLAEALRNSGMDRFRVSGEAPQVERLAAGAWLDTGGFGKGAAIRAAERVLRSREVGGAYLSFGGQVLAIGDPPGGGSWEVELSHPSRRGESAGVLRLDEGSVATSAQSERFVEVEGDRFGHLLDPRSGLPVRAWGSVTVVARDPLVADVLSTALFVMGPEAGLRWAEELEDVGVLFLEERARGVVPSWNTAFAKYTFTHTETVELQR